MPLPNLIVIGASRCGTTSLHAYLDLHPQIAMSRTKELNFFVAERNWGRGVQWYQRQFTDAPVRGESSPHYTARSRYEGVAARIASVVPEARLVYLVRDPVQRALSAYSLTRAMGLESRPLGQAMREDFRHGFYVEEGRYVHQLQPYLDVMPAEQLLVVDQDDLRHRRAETLAGVTSFLGLASSVDPVRVESAPEHNAAPVGRRRPWVSRLVPLLDAVVGGDRSRRMLAAVPSLVRTPFTTARAAPRLAAPAEDEVARLRDLFAQDVVALRRLSGLPLTSWEV